MSYREEDELAKEMAKKVCRFLSGWKFEKKEEDSYGSVLGTKEGKRLLFIKEYSKDRLSITGLWSKLFKFLPYNREKTEITVSMKKTPERIAKDIEKRLLPAYNRMFIEAMKIKERNDEYENKKKEALKVVSEIIGEKASYIAHDGGKIISYEPYHCEAEYRGEDQMYLRLTIPLNKAVRVLRLLKGQRPDIKF